MLRFSANLSMLFTEVPLIERFALARQCGFEAVEIQFPYELSPQAIAAQLQLHGQQLVLINAPAGDLMHGGDGLACVPGNEHRFVQAIHQAMHYADVLNVPCVNILAGRQPALADLLPCLQIFAKNLHFACQQFGSLGKTVVFEMINGQDMPGFLIQTMAQAQEMLEAVSHPALKIQFDCYHQAMMNEPVLTHLQENLPCIGHIQFADYPNRHEPDTGQLDFSAIFKLIAQSSYAGYTGAEYRPSRPGEESFAWLAQFSSLTGK